MISGAVVRAPRAEQFVLEMFIFDNGTRDAPDLKASKPKAPTGQIVIPEEKKP